MDIYPREEKWMLLRPAPGVFVFLLFPVSNRNEMAVSTLRTSNVRGRRRPGPPTCRLARTRLSSRGACLPPFFTLRAGRRADAGAGELYDIGVDRWMLDDERRCARCSLLALLCCSLLAGLLCLLTNLLHSPASLWGGFARHARTQSRAERRTFQPRSLPF